MERDKIFIQGYGFSGSSLIRDYLYEYDNITHLNTLEFDLARSSGGIYELGLLIENAWTWSLDSWARRYQRLIDYLYPLYKPILGENFLEYSNDFISKLLCYKIETKTLAFAPSEELKNPFKFLDKSNKNYKYYAKKYINKFFGNMIINPFMEQIAETNNIKNIYYIHQLSHKEYVKLAREYLINIFNLFPANKKVALVHPCNIIGLRIDSCLEYYDDKYKVIIIDKDPRDIYVAIQHQLKKDSSGYLKPISDLNFFIKTFKEARRFHNENIKILNEKVLFLTCEDFILNYDTVSKQVQNFLELDPNLHKNKFKFFNPDISIKNVRNYKLYEDQAAIKIIEQELKDYLKID